MAFEPDFLMILVFGKQGQLAQAFNETVPKELEGVTVFASSHDANFEKADFLEGYLDHAGPEIVVLCSAYTQTDRAEEERLLAEQLNVRAPKEIARWCGKNDALLIHFSTDYVFSGAGEKPWKETDETNPLSWYGETKLASEDAIQASGCRHFIFRTSWVYSENGKNFVKTMMKLGKDRDVLRVVNDQIGSPTYAYDIAENVWKIIKRYKAGEKFKFGIYHLTGQGFTNWADFASAIFEEARALKHPLKVQKVEGIPTSDYPTAAQRPLNSRLDQTKVKEQFGIEMPQWRESLKMCLKRMGVPT